MRNNHRDLLRSIASWLAFAFSGALAVSAAAFFQKMQIGVHLILKGYVAPVSFGIIIGLLARALLKKQMDISKKLQGLVDERTRELKEINQRLNTEIKDHSIAINKRDELLMGQKNIFNTIPLGIMYIDLNYNILKINRHMSVFTDMTLQQMEGKRCYEVIGNHNPEPGPCRACSLYKCYESKKTVAMERLVGDRYIMAITAPELDSNGKVYRYLKVYQDITSRKQDEIALKAAKEAAEAANVAKGVSLANMSHEIRTPMNAIIGMTDLCLETSDKEEQTEYLEHIRDAGESLLRILNDVLDMARIDSDRLMIETIPFNLNNLANSITNTYRHQATQKGLSIIMDIADDAKGEFMGDPYRLRQIISNLLSNAIKFTSSGSITMTISPEHDETSPDGATPMCFSVRDTGDGLSDEARGTVFERFSQVDSTFAKKHGGTGLGLSISKRIVELMNGTIWVESEPGVGSDFRFIIPLPPTNGASTAMTNKQQPRPHTHHTAPTEMLVVEDNAINRKLLKLALEKKGHTVTTACNGQEALNAMATKSFDMVFMDIQMPDLDGCEATYLIRQSRSTKNNSNIPIVAVTANALDSARQICTKSGMDDYLAKPIRISELYEMIDKHLSTTKGAHPNTP